MNATTMGFTRRLNSSRARDTRRAREASYIIPLDSTLEPGGRDGGRTASRPSPTRHGEEDPRNSSLPGPRKFARHEFWMPRRDRPRNVERMPKATPFVAGSRPPPRMGDVKRSTAPCLALFAWRRRVFGPNRCSLPRRTPRNMSSTDKQTLAFAKAHTRMFLRGAKRRRIRSARTCGEPGWTMGFGRGGCSCGQRPARRCLQDDRDETGVQRRMWAKTMSVTAAS